MSLCSYVYSEIAYFCSARIETTFLGTEQGIGGMDGFTCLEGACLIEARVHGCEPLLVHRIPFLIHGQVLVLARETLVKECSVRVVH